MLAKPAAAAAIAAMLMVSAVARGGGACPVDFVEVPPVLRAVADVGTTAAPARQTAGVTGMDAGDAFVFEAGRIVSGEAEIVLDGGARIVRGARGLFAERIVYRRATAVAVATGGVAYYPASGGRITADTLTLNLHTWAGEAQGVSIAIARAKSPPSATPTPSQNPASPSQSPPSAAPSAPPSSPPSAAPTPSQTPAAPSQSPPSAAPSAAPSSPPTPSSQTPASPSQSPTAAVAESPASASQTPAATTEIRARATAESVQFSGDEAQLLRAVTLTACAPGNRDVELRAREIVLDHAAGVGRAKGMTLRFKGAPVFYFPAATLPITGARKTGFLFPAAGYAGDSGAMLEAPYYLNLAPNYDATVTPRLWSRRGAQLAGEFRYLTQRGRGRLDGEFLPSDNNYDGRGDADRYALRARHEHRPAANWRAVLDWNSLSDEEYTRDFSSEVETVAASYIARSARLDYRGRRFGDLKFSAQAVAYESVDRAVARARRPYQRAPQFDLAWRADRGVLQAGLEAQYADFRHDHCATGDGDDAVACGSRLRVKPWLGASLRRSYGYLAPRVSWQSIRYALDERGAGAESSPSVSAPIFSLDGGLYFDRRLGLGGGEFTHTLEPRVRYVSIPTRRAQRAFPVFDTATADALSFAHLFRENRFFGGDRIGDTEQVAAGLVSRVVDGTGAQRLQLSLGQIRYLQDRKIGLDGAAAAPATWRNSGWFAAAAVALPRGWRVDAIARARDGERDNTLAWLHAAAEYRDAERRAKLAYTFRDAPAADTVTAAAAQTEQLSATVTARIGARWRAQLGGAYSLETDEFHAADAGLEFDGCCWGARITWRRYLDGDGAHKNRVKLAFELDALGG